MALGDRVLLRIPEAAERLALGRSTLYRLIASGELPTVKIGAALRIPAASLNTWAEERIKAAQAEDCA